MSLTLLSVRLFSYRFIAPYVTLFGVGLVSQTLPIWHPTFGVYLIVLVSVGVTYMCLPIHINSTVKSASSRLRGREHMLE